MEIRVLLKKLTVT